MYGKTISSSVVLLFLVAISSFAIWRIVNTGTGSYTSTVGAPDAFMQNFVSKQFRTDGTLKELMTATKLVHYSENDAAKFENCTIKLFDQNSALSWSVSANGGSSESGANLINLWGNVAFYHPATLDSKETRINTERAEIYLQEKYFESDVAVTFMQPNFIAKATGANVDLDKQVLNLLADVKETYLPNSRQAKDSNMFLNAADANKPAYMESDRVNHDFGAGVNTYVGKVKFQQGSTLVAADKLIAYTNKANKKISKVITFGKPSYYKSLQTDSGSGKYLEAFADSIEYYPTDSRAVLLGNARIAQDKTVINAPYVIYDLQKKELRTVSSPKEQTKVVIQQ